MRSWLSLTLTVPSPPPDPTGLAEVVAHNQHLGIRERALAKKWLKEPAVLDWNARAAAFVAADPRMSLPQGARLLAVFDAGLADALVACWKAKYAAMRPRPKQLAPGVEPVMFTPDSPAWPEDTSLAAGYATTFLARAFPFEAHDLKRDAAEAVEAPFHAGIATREDCRAGAALGVQAAEAAVRLLPP